MSDITLLAENFVLLFMESAPWLLLGLLVAGVMHELVPISLLQKHMGSSGPAAIGKAAVIGAPLPLCSCGVIPAAVGLRRSGASRPATVSFLVATPETGVDSVSVSYALLGPLFAIVRPFCAIISAVYAGMMVRLFAEQDTPSAAASENSSHPASSSCCSTSATAPEKVSSCCDSKSTQVPQQKAEPTSSCCASKTQQPDVSSQASSCCGTNSEPAPADKSPSLAAKTLAIWQFSTGKLLIDISIWLLIGLALAAAIQTWVPTDFLTRWGDGLLAMLVMAVIGIPMYICATASTPLAVGFLSAGLSPGAVLVFLLAGPATNISTMGMIAKEMGKRTLVLYIISVMSASILLGYGLNLLVSQFDLQGWITLGQSAHEHGEVSPVYALCAVILGALMLRNGWHALQQKFSKSSAASCCH
ncbi:SO_0444 family Cu/Zn efflux transporter [Alteromonas lipolytica]|uniref:Permease n=1 Tax=Alteromonas lipolytica TaxID=1856405 RepID=A0A1E8FIS4_9ALTE|nr:SO_0444 family Cu/Zn efflux transporter [Alteromonas lipolytica]OFI35830.1 permease [Alteromonas lipolytica]GGF81196.1 permease [Alteromonas lipolytica]